MKKTKIEINEFEDELKSTWMVQSTVLIRNITVFFAVVLLVSVIVFVPPSYWLIPSKTVNYEINPHKDPVMIIDYSNVNISDNISNGSWGQLIKKKSLNNSMDYYILPLARYSLSGRLIAKNTFFFDKTDFDKVALVDLGVVWGELADDNFFNKLSSNSRKYLDDARGLMVFFDEKYRREYGQMQGYVNLHFSHTHVIPSNRNVMRALNFVRIGQSIQIDGYLVDVFDTSKRRFVMTSLSNSDSNESSRSGGACEVMYVMRVQIGNKVFE